jgi:hypothetical protein
MPLQEDRAHSINTVQKNSMGRILILSISIKSGSEFQNRPTALHLARLPGAS